MLKERIQKELSSNIQNLSPSYKDIIHDIVRLKNIENPESVAKFFDYETDKLLEITTHKKELCKTLIKNINSTFNKKPSKSIKTTLAILKENILGKLFYLSLLDNKYLVIDQLSSHKKKQELLTELEVIRSSENSATLYLDILERGAHRNFITGIISYLY